MARILILVENLSVPFDRRVWQESRALVAAGHEVTVICPRGTKRDTEPYARIDGVEIHRYALEAATGGPSGYLREYGTALWQSWRLARKLDRRRPFDVVQACNPPDLLFLVALPLKARGARFVFDHHDLVPELFRSRFGKGGPLLWVNQVLERLTFRMADHVISTNESYRAIAVGRGRVPTERTTVVRSAPDLTRFVPVAPDVSLKRGRRHLVCYLGVMGPQDGVDYALRSLASLRDDLGRDDVQAAFVGHGDAWDDLVALSHELGLDDRVEFTGRVSDEDLACYLSTADVCLAPDPKNALNDISTMNKIVEYMAMSRPLVSFDLVEARVSAGDAALYATPNDEREFARLVAELLDDPDRRARMGAIGRRRVEQELSWEHSRRHLLEAYDGLLARSGALRSTAQESATKPAFQ
ncbi:MAG TPA: glycosyltransferase family 4 protein [Gaiellales bacterium]|jgi:glycosyltransferase involved in cell wall biosynthesis|nr:glycosyltransferase family 4 protein [Gaiellales bacterium]